MINIGLVGLGFIGKTHYQAYQEMDQAQVRTICVRDPMVEEEFLSQFDGTIVRNFDELLSDENIDMVDICLPTYLHEEFIIKAAQAGKHIICEKPLTLSLDSIDRIYDEVNKNGVKLFVGHILRFWPEYERIKKYSQSEELKDIEVVHAKRLSQFPSWSNWFKDPEKSGGALYDLHIHDIDFLYYLLGEVDSVYAVGTQNEYGAWNHIMTTLTFKNGAKAFVEASHRMPKEYPFTMSLRIHAKKSTLDFSVQAGENIEGIDESKQKFLYFSENRSLTPEIENTNPFENELTYFVNCVLHEQENTIIPLADVRYIIHLLKAIEKSLKTRDIVFL